MADGLNDARAMRVAEVMNGFRSIQHQIAQYQATPHAQDYQLVGYQVLRQCRAEAQALLSTPFDSGSLSVPTSPGEQTKRQLQRILLDASSRRFRAHKIFLRAAAAMRWVNRRNQILHGQRPQPSQTGVLVQADTILRSELAAVTDQRAYAELNAKDVAAGNWTAEMPNLSALLTYIQSHP